MFGKINFNKEKKWTVIYFEQNDNIEKEIPVHPNQIDGLNFFYESNKNLSGENINFDITLYNDKIINDSNTLPFPPYNVAKITYKQ